jgi:hypothetical protein
MVTVLFTIGLRTDCPGEVDQTPIDNDGDPNKQLGKWARKLAVINNLH